MEVILNITSMVRDTGSNNISPFAKKNQQALQEDQYWVPDPTLNEIDSVNKNVNNLENNFYQFDVDRPYNMM